MNQSELEIAIGILALIFLFSILHLESKITKLKDRLDKMVTK